ncbi:MAG: MbcA/ParS/Xre antitoxin family protein [Desulfuromonadales bacterium]|nr:MbcA/ParS/Xre antitoxin family protein [Desulfuromonadales bacterium]
MTRPIVQPTIDLHNAENRRRLAKMTVRLFDHWELSTKDQAALLGLSTEGRTSISRYRKGFAFADSQDLLGRAGHLLGIHKSLRLIFPHNIELAYRWISQPNRRFGYVAPLDIMKQGYEGLLAVRRYLDFERGR